MAAEITGTGIIGPYLIAAAPVAGSNEVQTLTIGGTPTGGTFVLSLGARGTAPVAWANVNATLLTALNAALDAAFGASQIVATAGTLTAGIGTILLTFSGSVYAKRNVDLMTATSFLTGTSPTLTIAETTAGVAQTLAGAAKGAMALDAGAGKLYVNTGTAASPTWTVVGSQT